MTENKLLLTSEKIEEIDERRKYNEDIAKLYYEHFDHTRNEKYLDVAQNVKACSNNWFFKTWEQQRTKKLESVQTCKNRFCPVCQKAVARTRYKRFEQKINEYAETNDIYHCTLTATNVSYTALKNHVEKIIACFPKLIRYFNGAAKIRGIDFSQYGYVCGFRSIETTYKIHKVGSEFHVHIHSLLVLKKDLDLPEHVENTYSRSKNKKGIKKFSDLEILLQKIWYLLVNDIKVTGAEINKLALGYSCTCQKVKDGNYAEVFKYAVKGVDEDGTKMSYIEFAVMEAAFHKKKVVQGYGGFYGIEKEEIDLSDIDIMEVIEEHLNSQEKAYLSTVCIDFLKHDLKTNQSGYIYISGKRIQEDLENQNEYDLSFLQVRPDLAESRAAELAAAIDFESKYLRAAIRKYRPDITDKAIEKFVSRVRGTNLVKTFAKVFSGLDDTATDETVGFTEKDVKENKAFILRAVEESNPQIGKKARTRNVLYEQRIGSKKDRESAAHERYKYTNDYEMPHMTEKYIKSLIRKHYKAFVYVETKNGNRLASYDRYEKNKVKIRSALIDSYIYSETTYSNFWRIVDSFKSQDPITYDAMCQDLIPMINNITDAQRKNITAEYTKRFGATNKLTPEETAKLLDSIGI